VDSAGKDVIDDNLKNSNIINIIIMKMDPENDIGIVKSALCLLESLLLSENSSNDDDDDNEDEEMDGEKDEEDEEEIDEE
jgi:hypothetical protein